MGPAYNPGLDLFLCLLGVKYKSCFYDFFVNLYSFYTLFL